MGFKKFINSLKNFGDTISSAADSVFDEVDKTFDGLDTSKLTPEQEKEIERKLEEKVYEASEAVSSSWSPTRTRRRPTKRTKSYTFPRYTVSIPNFKATSRARRSDCFGVGPGEAILYRGK